MQEKQLQELLGSLSLTEKIGQLVQVPGEVLNAEGQELGSVRILASVKKSSVMQAPR
ncbi:MAG: hypothetical protein ACLVAW_07050 [Eisenbergiella massiliensis]